MKNPFLAFLVSGKAVIFKKALFFGGFDLFH